jgi:hypothetical protein
MTGLNIFKYLSRLLNALGSVRLELVPRADYDVWLKNLSK